MHLKFVVRVELNQLSESDTSSCVHVSYSPSDSVISIKQKLQLLTGIPALSQTLSHATTQLSDSDTLHSLSVSRNAIPTLYMHVPIRGGAARSVAQNVPFEFKDITNEECFQQRTFATTAPMYRCIGKGISYEARCTNEDCISFQANHCVSVYKGMYPDRNGHVSIRREIYKLTCPACNCRILPENCVNLIFSDCTAEIEWVLANEATNNGKYTLITGEGVYKEGKPTVAIIQYHCLDIALK